MFTDAEKAELDSLYSVCYESFKEYIIAYQSPQQNLTGLNSNYNFAFGATQPTANEIPVVQSGQLYATVQYMNSISDQVLKTTSNSTVLGQNSYVKLGVSGQTDIDFMNGAIKVVVNGIEFEQATKERLRGIVSRDYAEYFFKRID